MNCPKCRKKTRMKSARRTHKRKIVGRQVSGQVRCRKCPTCGEVSFPGSELEAFDIATAAMLVADGARSGSAFRFCRQALGARTKDLAEIFEIAAAEVTALEKQREVGACHWLILTSLVFENYNRVAKELGRDPVQKFGIKMRPTEKN